MNPSCYRIVPYEEVAYHLTRYALLLHKKGLTVPYDILLQARDCLLDILDSGELGNVEKDFRRTKVSSNCPWPTRASAPVQRGQTLPDIRNRI